MYPWIDEIIIGLNEKYETNDVYELYDYLHIEIRKLPKLNILLRGNDSFYFRDYHDTEIVFIREDLNENLEKFILFHELGHALLHIDILETYFNRSLINKGKYEKQANYFAYKMLNIEFDEIELRDMSLEQVCICIKIPYDKFAEIINF